MIASVSASLHNIVKGSALIFFGMVASLLLWFATKVLIIRNCTKEELGVYSLAVAIISIFALLSNLGLHEGVSRYISIYLGEGKKENALGIARDAFFIGALSSVAVLVAVFFSSGIMSKYIFYKPELEVPLKVMSLFIPFSVMANIANGILRGHNIIQPKVFMDVGQPFLFLVFLGLFAFFGLSFISIIYAYVFAIAVIFFAVTAFTFNKIRVNIRELVWSNKRELLLFSIPLLAVSALGIILSWADTLMLGRYAKVEDVGIYNVSVSLAKLLTFPLGAISFVFMPVAGNMYAKGQIPELKRTYQVLTKWIFSVTLPIFFILFFFPEMTITFLFGQRFVDASVSLRILALCFLLHTSLGANGMLLLVMGMSSTIMKVSLLGVLVNVGFNYILIKLLGYGVIGASVSTLISYLALNVTISIIIYQNSKIHPFTLKYLKPALGSSIIGIMLYVLAKSLPLYFWMLPVYFLLFIVGYGTSLLLTKSIEAEDLYMMERIFNRLGFRPRRFMETLSRLTHEVVKSDTGIR